MNSKTTSSLIQENKGREESNRRAVHFLKTVTKDRKFVCYGEYDTRVYTVIQKIREEFT